MVAVAVVPREDLVEKEVLPEVAHSVFLLSTAHHLFLKIMNSFLAPVAMAGGLASVACDNRGNRELIEDGRQGLLFPPGDAEALADVLVRLLGDPELARRLGMAAQDRVEADFSLAKMVEAHVTLFDELLSES